MDVGVTELRAHLRDWLEHVRTGGEVVVTEHGAPIARIMGVKTTSLLDELTQQGVIARPGRPRRPRATGRAKPRPRRPLADIVTEQRG